MFGTPAVLVLVNIRIPADSSDFGSIGVVQVFIQFSSDVTLLADRRKELTGHAHRVDVLVGHEGVLQEAEDDVGLGDGFKVNHPAELIVVRDGNVVAVPAGPGHDGVLAIKIGLAGAVFVSKDPVFVDQSSAAHDFSVLV